MIDYSHQDILVLYFYTKQCEIKSFTRVLLHSLVNGHQVEALGDAGQRGHGVAGQIRNVHKVIPSKKDLCKKQLPGQRECEGLNSGY